MTSQPFKMHPGVTHTGTIKVAPVDIDKFLEALRTCWLEVCREPECLFFDVFHSQAEPGTFHFIEVWSKDNDWFMDVQIKKDYYKPYWDVTRPMWISRDMHTYDRLAGWSFIDEKYLQGAITAREDLG